MTRSEFCCDGCASVFSWLNEQGLGDYYTLRERSTPFGPVRSPLPLLSDHRASDYAYLDDPTLYAQREDPRQLTFYLEGFHCFACIWLLERLPEHVAGLESLEFDPTESLARVRLSEGGKFSTVADALARIGYRPHLIPDGQDSSSQEARQKERRLQIMRLAVAGAAAGNIMMFALAVYAGAPQSWERGFNWISFLLYIPAIGFSATPLFREAIAALRTKRLAVEIPLMAGITLASIFSTYNLFRGSDQVFFDSLSSLLFLLLASRAVLGRIQSGALKKNHLLALLTPSRVQLADESRTIECSALRVGDHIRVAPFSVIPVDGKVIHGSSHVSRAALTGESNWEHLRAGDRVEAGSRNQESELTLEVLAQGYQTRLGRILRAIESGAIRKPALLLKLERWSAVFVAIVLGAAALAWQSGGWERAVALLIIVCPCGLALAGPLTFAQGLASAARRGIWVNGGAALERVAIAREIVFDKTGTLTQGDLQILQWQWSCPPEEHEEAELAALTLGKKSQHPVARALVSYLEKKKGAHLAAPQVERFVETLGYGIQGEIAGTLWSVHRSPEGTMIQRDLRPIAQLTTGDALRMETPAVLKKLRSLHLPIWMLTGDRLPEAKIVGSALEIAPSMILAKQSPEEKLAFIQNHPHALMVGDGANDAAALSGAAVSATLNGSAELALRSSDVFLGSAGLGGIPILLAIARRTVHVLQIAIGFSLFYNAIAIGLVLQGYIAPWLAALIMPLSALSVWSTTRIGFWIPLRSDA